MTDPKQISLADALNAGITNEVEVYQDPLERRKLIKRLQLAAICQGLTPMTARILYPDEPPS